MEEGYVTVHSGVRTGKAVPSDIGPDDCVRVGASIHYVDAGPTDGGVSFVIRPVDVWTVQHGVDAANLVRNVVNCNGVTGTVVASDIEDDGAVRFGAWVTLKASAHKGGGGLDATKRADWRLPNTQRESS